MIKITNLYKSFNKGKNKVFQNVSVDFKEKEIIGLIGQNGSGKTTLIKMICGLVLPDSGDVKINGVSIVKDFKKAKSFISVMSDSNTSLFMNLSGYENLEYFAALKGVISATERNKKMDYLITKLKMGNYIKLNANTYSKRMRQRLLFAIALISEPKLLILDEPVNGLDADNAMIMMEYLKELVEEKNTTVILTSHDKYFLGGICTEKYVITNNNVIKESNNYKISKEITIYLKVNESVNKEVEGMELELIDEEKKLYKCIFTLNNSNAYNYIGKKLEANNMIRNILTISKNEFRLMICNLKNYPFSFMCKTLQKLILIIPLLVGLKQINGFAQFASLTFLPIVSVGVISSKISDLRQKGIVEQLFNSSFSLGEYIISNIILKFILSSPLICIILIYNSLTNGIYIDFKNLLFIISILFITNIALEFIFGALTLRFRKVGMLLSIIQFFFMIIVVMPLYSLNSVTYNLVSIVVPIAGIITYAQSLAGTFVFSSNGIYLIFLNLILWCLISILCYKKMFNSIRKIGGFSNY